MDFRSQLSAFRNGSNGEGGGGGNNNNGDRNDRSRSPNRRFHSNNNNNNNNNRGGGGNGGRYGNQYGEGSDRRRPRPGEWGSNSHYGGDGPPNTRRRYNNQHPNNVDPDGLGDLRRHNYRIPRGFPDPPTDEERAKQPKHIVLMAITIEDMPFEHVWRGWCDTLKAVPKDQDDFFLSLVCHAKYPEKVQSEWLKQRLLTHPPQRGRGNSYEDPTYLTRTPAWGSVEITRAMLDLLQESLKIGKCTQTDKRFSANRFLIRVPPTFQECEDDSKIPPADHFLFISETCLPVATAPEFFSKIANVAVSWVNARHRRQEDTPKNKYEDDQFAGINRRIPGQYRWKADQWVLLSRRHASLIIELDRPQIPQKHQLWQSFREINASDEMYFPTALALLGFLRYTKDGDDTQKSRAVVPNPSGASGAVSETAMKPTSSSGLTLDTGNGTAATSDGTGVASAVTNKNESILLRPVTYTDWTQGMKNPAMFCNGPKDLKRVSRLARGIGCLVARKFSTHLPIPGVPKEEVKMTGEITVGQWNEVMSELHREEADAETVLPYASESVQEVEEVTVENKHRSSRGISGDEAYNEADRKTAMFAHTKGEEDSKEEGSDDKDADVDDDQEENQLD
ncbi:core-2/I-branching enzyme [Nitzschia inconspicua]|uniref:Core-2/I-branching enzyme n=1 Tax=Nitzschia inconspicua TaxID=303405 RepID=A0A9K3L7B1_9STRA|nr:core-2/I-branching enzyme [Nitzschia inconspicua]